MELESNLSKDHDKLLQQCSALFSDFSNSKEQSSNLDLVIVIRNLRVKRSDNVCSLLTNVPSKSMVVVLIDASQMSKMTRIFAFMLRNLTVKLISRLMIKRDINPIASYAIYPDLQDTKIVFQRDSGASKYAEEYLLGFSNGAMRRSLEKMLRILFKDTPKIDVVAVLGRKS